MSLQHVVVQLLCKQFEETCRRDPTKAMKITFGLHIDYDKEEGYRDLELLIYAPTNYVAVASRETWRLVVNNEDVDGESEWTLHSYHDSCWRSDGVEGVIRKYGKRISNISFDGVQFVPSENIVNIVNALLKARR